MRNIGYKVAFLRAYVNGKIKVIRGQRRSFVHFAAKQAARLELIAKSGKALVGYDPALTICYRDEYTQMLGDRCGEFDVKLPEEWLNEQFGTKTFVERFAKIKDKVEQTSKTDEFKDPYFLFTHCTERALITQSPVLWQTLMQHFFINVIPETVACCGMAGLFGHIAKIMMKPMQFMRKTGRVRLTLMTSSTA